MLYGVKGPVPDASQDYIIPLGVADIKRPGKDVTIVSYSRQVMFCLAAVPGFRRRALKKSLTTSARSKMD